MDNNDHESSVNLEVKTESFCPSSDDTVSFISPILQPMLSEDKTIDYDTESKVKIENLSDQDHAEIELSTAIAGACVYCDKVFRLRSSLLAHKFKCTKNPNRLKIFYIIKKEHFRRLHRPIPRPRPKIESQLKINISKYSCEYCHVNFQTSAILKNHLASTLRLRKNCHTKLNCTHCGQEDFLYPCQTRWHTRQQFCAQCKLRFKCQVSYLAHISDGDGCQKQWVQGEYPCFKCSKIFTSTKNLYRHWKDSSCINNNKIYNCEIEFCGKKFPNLRSFREHQNTHRFKFPCTHCGYEFTKKNTLNSHLKIMLPVEEGHKFKCDRCKKVFESRCLFKIHDQIEKCGGSCVDLYDRDTGQTQPIKSMFKFPCNHCGHAFPKKSNLNTHLKRMLPEEEGQKFKCDRCDEAFESKCLFRKHEQIKKCGGSCVDHYDRDMGQTQPIKSMCNAESLTFAEIIQKRVLQKSIAVPVPKPKPLTKNFNSNSYTALSCPHCQRTFTMEVSLQRHLNLNLRPDAGNLQLECSSCDQKFAFRCQKSYHTCNNKDPLISTENEVSQSHHVESDPLSTPNSIIKIEPLSTSALTPSQDEQDEDSGGPFHCWACGISFDQKIQFFNHVRTIHNEEPAQFN